MLFVKGGGARHCIGQIVVVGAFVLVVASGGVGFMFIRWQCWLLLWWSWLEVFILAGCSCLGKMVVGKNEKFFFFCNLSYLVIRVVRARLLEFIKWLIFLFVGGVYS